MTTTDDSGSTVPAEALQFEHADFTAPPAPVTCAACARPIADAYYEINRKVLCGACRDGLAARFTGGSGTVRFLRASVFGALAALAGTALYCLVLALTGYEVALIAIVVGYMVGTAVRRGARYRGGWPYQGLAVFLTYTSIVAAYLPLFVAEIRKQGNGQPAAGVAAEPAPPGQDKVPAPVARADTPEPINEPAKAPVPRPSVGQLVMLLGMLVAFLYAAPFLQGAGNLIGLLIIFFGLMQAWRLNKKVHLAINGPFQVSGGGPPPQESSAHA